MADVSDKYRELYHDSYAGGSAQAWRDAGAVYKAENVIAAWTAVKGEQRPSVVEIGCGDGALADRLGVSNFFTNYRGFDLSPSGITEARARCVQNANFTVVDGASIPLEKDSADLAVLSHVVEHLEHPRSLLHEAGRIAPLVLIEVPLERHWRTPRDFEWTDLGHINLYDTKTIRQLVQSCDLDVIWQRTTQPGPESYFFFGGGLRRRAAFATKKSGLRFAPPLARNLFTYHETLLARRHP